MSHNQRDDPGFPRTVRAACATRKLTGRSPALPISTKSAKTVDKWRCANRPTTQFNRFLLRSDRMPRKVCLHHASRQEEMTQPHLSGSRHVVDRSPRGVRLGRYRLRHTVRLMELYWRPIVNRLESYTMLLNTCSEIVFVPPPRVQLWQSRVKRMFPGRC